MNASLRLVFVLCAALALSSVASAREPQPPVAEIEKLILQLGSDDYAQRAAAARQLTRFGVDSRKSIRNATITALREASKNPKYAISSRARVLIETLTPHPGQVWCAHTGDWGRDFSESGSSDISPVAFFPDGKKIVSAGANGYVQIWDAKTGQELRRIKENGMLTGALAVSPDGRLVAVAICDRSQKSSFHVWESATGKTVHRLTGLPDVWSLAFSVDGRELIAAGGDVRVFHVKTMKEIRRIGEKRSRYWGLSREGKFVCAYIGDDLRFVVLVDVRTGKDISRFSTEKMGNTARSVAYLPEMTHLLFNAGNIQLWTIATGKRYRTFNFRRTTNAIAVSSDGKLALSGHGKPYYRRGWFELTVDRTVRLWDIKTGQRLASYKSHEGGVSSVAFSPDRKYAVSGDHRGKVRMWKLPPMGVN